MVALVPGLAPATTYSFRVCAENALGRGAWSGPSITVLTDPA